MRRLGTMSVVLHDRLSGRNRLSLSRFFLLSAAGFDRFPIVNFGLLRRGLHAPRECISPLVVLHFGNGIGSAIVV